MLLLNDRRSGANSPNSMNNGDEALKHIYSVLRREVKLIFAVVVMVVAVAAAIVFVIPPSYTATSTLLIDPRAGGVFNSQFQFQIGPSDPAIIDSQVEIIRSEHIARMVIDKLDLKNDPELLGQEGPLSTAMRAVLTAIRGDVEPTEHERLQQVLKSFQKNVEVQRSQQTFIVDVSFRSYSAEKAARIANAIAEAYLADRLQARFNTTKLTSGWLNDRLKELREAAVAADARVEAYKTANKIVGAGTILINEKELADVSPQLLQARAATAEAEARYTRMRDIVAAGDIESAVTSEVLSNTLVQKLRTDYGELSKKEFDLAKRFSPTHQALIQVRQQIGEIRRLILEEYARIAETAKNELEIARSREKAIADRMQTLTEFTTSTNEAQVQLRELMREAASSRAVYENFLQRHKEMTQQETLPVTETRIVTAATPPVSPSHPKRLMILFLCSGGALALGIGLALLFDRFDPTLHSAAELEELTETECLGLVPTLSLADGTNVRRRRRGEPAAPRGPATSKRQLPADLGGLSLVVKEPTSQFAEAMRSIKVAAQFRAVSSDLRVIAVTSALPREGKTTIASNLAQHLASTGHRVVLMDADLRNRSISRRLTPKASAGLIEAVAGSASLEELLYDDPNSGLRFLPAYVKSGTTPNTEEILASDRFKAFLKETGKSYDFIVLDGPPVLPVVDLRAMVGAVDGFVFVAEWGHTPRNAIESAVRVSDTFQSKLLGGVLNKVRVDRIDYYGGYYGSQYYFYGQDRKLEPV